MKTFQKVILTILIASFPIGLFLILMPSFNVGAPKAVENFEALLETQVKHIEQLDAEATRMKEELVKIEQAKISNIEHLKELKQKLEQAIKKKKKKVTQNNSLTPVRLAAAANVTVKKEPDLPAFAPMKTKLGNMIAIALEKQKLEDKNFFSSDIGKLILSKTAEAGSTATVYLAGVQKPSKIYSYLRNTFEENNQQEVMRLRDKVGSADTIYIMIKQTELASKAKKTTN